MTLFLNKVGRVASRLKKRWIFLFWLISSFILCMFSWETIKLREINNLQTEVSTLAESLDSHLARFSSLPGVLAQMVDVKRVLFLQSDVVVEKSNLALMSLNRQLGSDVIYILSPDGLTVASSNFNEQDSFVGINYGFRPYFRQAIANGQGAYHAFGIASGKLGYYFSSAVYSGGNVIGVIVVKVNLDFIEGLLDIPERNYMVSDSNGVIFLALNPEWMYKSLSTINSLALESIRDSRQYGGNKVEGDLSRPDLNQKNMICVVKNKWCEKYLYQSNSVVNGEWLLHLLLPKKNLVISTLNILIFYSALFWLSVYVYLYYRNQYEHRKYLAENNKRLESRVSYLTSDIRNKNIDLLESVDHYRTAKEELEKTQDELIQAEKLALLGEVSVGLHHELNQPILAIKAYSSNGELFLQRGQLDSVEENLLQINKISDTMSRIVSQFKVFSRKEVSIAITSLEDVVEGALLITRPNISSNHVQLIRSWTEGQTPSIKCNSVQVQQVIVNLVTNAIQAMEKTNKPMVDIHIGSNDDESYIEVSDNGPGLGINNLEQIFTPFFTTKPQGLGLGLSLSKRIVEMHKGKILTKENEDGGTVFRISFPNLKVEAG